MSRARISIPREELAELCRRHHIRRLSLFGSVLTDDFHDESDVDVLVEFEPGIPVGFRIVEIEEDLSRVFDGRAVDIVSPKYLNHRIRDDVLREAEVQYAGA